MFDGKFRAPIDKAVRPVGRLLRKTGLSPDHLTIIGVLVAIGAAWAIAVGSLYLGFALVILAAIPDLLDGALAKASGAASQRGAFLDSTVDRVTDAFLLGGVAYYFATHKDPRLAVLPYAVSALAMVISYQRAKAESLGLDAKGGLMERAERIVLLCIGLLLEPFVDDALVWVMWLMLALITLTAVQRFVKVWKQAAVAPITQARIDMRRQRRASRRARRRTRVPLRTRVPRKRD
jgi:CDP-diacylglycerol--glycerol-3-phosphate 3-phosphatidyltransferase